MSKYRISRRDNFTTFYLDYHQVECPPFHDFAGFMYRDISLALTLSDDSSPLHTQRFGIITNKLSCHNGKIIRLITPAWEQFVFED